MSNNEQFEYMFQEFLESDLAWRGVSYKLKESILSVRQTITTLELLKRKHVSLSKEQKGNLEANLEYIHGLTLAYMWFSGDENLDELPEWFHTYGKPETPGWEYWHEGDMS